MPIFPNSSAMDATASCGGPITMLPQIVTGEPEQILAHVEQLLQKAAAFAALLSQFEQAQQQLEKAWSGGAAESAVTKITDSLQAFEKIIKVIEEGASLLGISAGMVRAAQTAYQSIVGAVNPTVASLMSNPWTYGAAVALSTATSASLRAFIQAVQGMLTALGAGELGAQIAALVSIISEIEQLMQRGTGDANSALPQQAPAPVIAPTPPSVVNPIGSAPAGSVGSMPAGASDSTSPGAAGSMPAGAAPAASVGSTPASPAGSVPAGAAGSMPASSAGSVPPASFGSAPSSSLGSAAAGPAGSAGSMPDGSAGSVPPASFGSAPDGSAGSMPPASFGSMPPSSFGSMPVSPVTSMPTDSMGYPAADTGNTWVPVDPASGHGGLGMHDGGAAHAGGIAHDGGNAHGGHGHAGGAAGGHAHGGAAGGHAHGAAHSSHAHGAAHGSHAHGAAHGSHAHGDASAHRGVSGHGHPDDVEITVHEGDSTIKVDVPDGHDVDVTVGNKGHVHVEVDGAPVSTGTQS